MRALVILTCLLFITEQTSADIITFQSSTPANNATERTNWLNAIGIGAPEFLVDFESGFTDGQNISGVGGLFPAGMVITDTGPSAAALIETDSGAIGGSNPVGNASVTQDERQYLELDFSANPVGYVGFNDIDHTGTNILVSFVGGGSDSFSIETTGSSGNTAEFVGIYRNDQPRITLIRLDASGDGDWGIDNIEYGDIAGVPEPSTWALLTLAGVGFGGYQMRRKRQTIQQQD